MRKLYIFLIVFFSCITGTILIFTSNFFLKTQIYSDNPKVKRWAIDTLVEKGASVVPSILPIAEDEEEEEEIRRAAVFILGEVHEEKTAPNLITLMNEGPLLIRQQAAYSLRKMKDPVAFEALREAYKTGPHPVRAKALFALGEMDNPKVLPILKEALLSPDTYFREVAGAALEIQRSKKK
ncbi:MAG: HEAT repeat domain-containing protein [Nitrospinota bacterium]